MKQGGPSWASPSVSLLRCPQVPVKKTQVERDLEQGRLLSRTRRPREAGRLPGRGSVARTTTNTVSSDPLHRLLHRGCCLPTTRRRQHLGAPRRHPPVPEMSRRSTPVSDLFSVTGDTVPRVPRLSSTSTGQKRTPRSDPRRSPGWPDGAGRPPRSAVEVGVRCARRQEVPTQLPVRMPPPPPRCLGSTSLELEEGGGPGSPQNEQPGSLVASWLI